MIALAALGIAYLVSGLDDLWIDLVALVRRIRPRRLSGDEVREIEAKPERVIAILVPAWKEASVIRRMLAGNSTAIRYTRFHFFVGVYPNDPETLAEVEKAAREYPRIHAVVNSRPGPTTKGQLLNHMIRQSRRVEKDIGVRFDAFVLHDAEDLIHAFSLKLANHLLDRFDYVQLPVFSLPTPAHQLVSGTYMDEFAESHTKDLLVREALGAAVPSAGVGTFVSRGLALALFQNGGGELFDGRLVTEDYALGVRTHALGFGQHFAAYRLPQPMEGGDFVATREFFPRHVGRSIRQKTRWTTGIALQGWRTLGWPGSPANRYFLARDRKGLLCNPLALLGYPVAALAGALALTDTAASAALLGSAPEAFWLMGANAALMLNRLGQRISCSVRVYGWRQAWLVPIRWPVSVGINGIATLEALARNLRALVADVRVQWVKTEHELPAYFGAPKLDGPRVQAMILAFGLFGSVGGLAAEKCVRIYYDSVPTKQDYRYGRVHAMFLQNLLGHFPAYQQYVSPIERYQKGDIDNCDATFYLGTYYDDPKGETRIPKAFLDEFLSTSRSVVWAGYNFWHLGDAAIRRTWKAKFTHLSDKDTNKLDEKGRPTFFRFYEYKGETFHKYGEWDATVPKRYNASWEISLFEIAEADEENVVSWGVHNGTGDTTPYILRNGPRGKRWYIGDSPFSFMHEEDRYLIFADILFDILNEAPRYPGKKPALFRLEDVHPMIPLWQLYRVARKMKEMKVPFSISLIPIFADPFEIKSNDPLEKFVPISRKPLFVEYLREVEKQNATFIYHGVSHQSGMRKNPWNGLTGDDFEFWDRSANAPMKYRVQVPDGLGGMKWVDEKETPKIILNRLDTGMELFSMVGVRPLAWLTPHYQASPLGYRLFSQLFTWNVGRIIYFPHEFEQKERLPEALTLDRAGALPTEKRLSYVQDVRADFEPTLLPNGQFFPYEIYGDAYDQRLIPENVGNVQPYMNEQVYIVQTIDDLVRIARRNRVLRDQWASFFLHPFRLNDTTEEGVGTFPGDTRGIERLIREIRSNGYEFIDLKDWMAKAPKQRRPPAIETLP